MTSSTALRVRGQVSVDPGERRAGPPPARRLRVLPPPRSYAEMPEPLPAPARGRMSGPRATVGRSPGRGRRERVEQPPLRLTSRGRRVLAVLTLLLAAGVIVLGSAVLGDAGGGLELMGTTNVIVEPGDTLWSIAGAVADGRDVRDVVVDIQRLNGLGSAAISPGQVLVLP
ncbi:LysM peptidoglycan-binding domain-containing protein [Blastococcus sp. SYSU DS1021]